MKITAHTHTCISIQKAHSVQSSHVFYAEQTYLHGGLCHYALRERHVVRMLELDHGHSGI